MESEAFISSKASDISTSGRTRAGSGSLQSFYPERPVVKTNFHNMYRRAVRELGVAGLSWPDDLR